MLKTIPIGLGLVTLIMAALTGCAQTLEPDPTLAHACQIKPCICRHEVQTVFGEPDTVPILWHDNGDAYCPEEYVLELVSGDE